MSKQDRHGARTVAQLEQKYDWNKTFAEVYGLVADAQNALEEANRAIEGIDKKLTHEEIFNLLTDNGTVQGIYRGEDDAIYINASYIKGGMISADYIDTGGLMVSNLLGSYVGLYSYTKGEVGGINIAETTTGYGLEISTNAGGIKLTSAGNWWVEAQYGELGITSSGIVCGVSPVPLSTGIDLGSANYPWSDIYTDHGTFSEVASTASYAWDAVEVLSDTVGLLIETVESLSARVKTLEGDTTEE